MSNEIPQLLKRVLLILDFLEELARKNTGQETFQIRFDDFAKRDELLADYHGAQLAFKKITQDNSEAIALETVNSKPADAGEHSRSRVSMNTFWVVLNIYIDDPKHLKIYKHQIENEVASKKQLVSLILSHEGRKAHLRIKGEAPEIKCSFSIAGMRYEILKRLVESGEYIPTKELASELEVKEGRIRKEIGAMRERIASSLHIDAGRVIENNPRKGYRLLNVEAKD